MYVVPDLTSCIQEPKPHRPGFPAFFPDNFAFDPSTTDFLQAREEGKLDFQRQYATKTPPAMAGQSTLHCSPSFTDCSTTATITPGSSSRWSSDWDDIDREIAQHMGGYPYSTGDRRFDRRLSFEPVSPQVFRFDPCMSAQTEKIFVGGVPQRFDDHDLWEVFADYGVVKKAWLQKVQAHLVPKGQQGQFAHRGFGFVVFQVPKSVDSLLQGMQARFIYLADGHRVEIKRAVMKKSQQDCMDAEEDDLMSVAPEVVDDHPFHGLGYRSHMNSHPEAAPALQLESVMARSASMAIMTQEATQAWLPTQQFTSMWDKQSETNQYRWMGQQPQPDVAPMCGMWNSQSASLPMDYFVSPVQTQLQTPENKLVAVHLFAQGGCPGWDVSNDVSGKDLEELLWQASPAFYED